MKWADMYIENAGCVIDAMCKCRSVCKPKRKKENNSHAFFELKEGN